MPTLEQVKAYFEKDLYATKLSGIEITEVKQHYAVCRMPVTAEHKNARGTPMGGAIFTLADFAAAVAANSELADEHVISLRADISYLNAAKGECLYATARCIKHGGSTTLYRVDVADALGTQVALVSVTGYVLKNLRKKS